MSEKRKVSGAVRAAQAISYSLNCDYLRVSMSKSNQYLHETVCTDQQDMYFESVSAKLAQSYGIKSNTIEPCRYGRYGYRYSVQLCKGIILFGIHRTDEFGICLQFSGIGLDYMRSVGWTDNALAMRVHWEGWQCSRLDWAMDIHNGRTVAYLEHLLDTEQWVIKGNIKLTGWRDYKTSAGTLYIGSRSSDSFLRIYDKGKKEGESQSRTRYEIQYQRKFAQYALICVVDDNTSSLDNDLIKKATLPIHNGLISRYDGKLTVGVHPQSHSTITTQEQWLRRCMKSIVKTAGAMGVDVFCTEFNEIARKMSICQIWPDVLE